MSPDNPELRIALVGPRHLRLYQNSPIFHSAIDTLARMLPSWVDGLATESERVGDEMAANFQRSMYGQSMLPIQPPSFVEQVSLPAEKDES